MAKIKIIAINGSPRKNGKTSSLLKKFLSLFKRKGAQTTLINLVDYKINHCLGCYSQSPRACRFPCVQKDDLQKIYPLLLEADVIILGSPIYWFNMSGLMKNFIDRLTGLAASGYSLENKVGISLSASNENEGGRVSASLSMASVLNHLGLFIPPYGILFYPGREKLNIKGKVIWDNWLDHEMPKISSNLITLSKFLKKEKFKW